MTNIIKPFDGGPKTRAVTDASGNLNLIVRPRELTPLRARLASRLGNLCAAGVMAAGFYGLATMPEPSGWLWALPVVAAALSEKPLTLAWRFALKKRARLVFTPEAFEVRTLLGWKRYDRKLSHRFALLNHDKAQAEAQEQELAARRAQARGRILSMQRYYGESFHLVFEYVGQRHDVMTIYGAKEATAVAARLKACDQYMDKIARIGNGVALDPAEEWGTQPGDI